MILKYDSILSFCKMAINGFSHDIQCIYELYLICILMCFWEQRTFLHLYDENTVILQNIISIIDRLIK